MSERIHSELRGRVALVTGASSGFGVDFARILAAHGCTLVLVARREDRLKQLAGELARDHGIATHVVPQDLAAPGAAETLVERTRALGLDVDVLVNNAGYGVFGPFLDVPLARTRAMLAVEVGALTDLTRLFAEPMRARGRGWVLLVSSIGAFQATPGYSTYSAAKSYVLSFGEAIAAELAPHGVKVSTVCPGVAATEFIETAGQRKTLYQRLSMMPSRSVAEAAVKAMLRGKPCRIPGLQNSLPVFLMRFTPRRVATAMAGLFMKN